eukprot:80217-Amorphochlora_amoeboformis.AAC.1
MAKNLLLIIDLERVSSIYALPCGLPTPPFAISGLICTLADSTSRSGFTLDNISSEKCRVVLWTPSEADSKRNIGVVFATSEMALPVALIHERINRIIDMIVFLLGPSWRSHPKNVIHAHLDSVTPVIYRYISGANDSLDSCLGYPRVLPSGFKFTHPAKLKSKNYSEVHASFMRIGALLHRDKVCGATDLWKQLVQPHDVYCLAHYLTQFQGDTEQLVPCFLRHPEGKLDDPNGGDFRFLFAENRAQTFMVFQGVSDLSESENGNGASTNATYVLRSADYTRRATGSHLPTDSGNEITPRRER